MDSYGAVGYVQPPGLVRCPVARFYRVAALTLFIGVQRCDLSGVAVKKEGCRGTGWRLYFDLDGSGTSGEADVGRPVLLLDNDWLQVSGVPVTP